MNMGNIVRVSDHFLSSNVGVSDQFPVGLRVLVVDDDPTCLMILEKMLHKCHYRATKCNKAEDALSLLRKNKNGFDIVISDVHMPDMDGFKLLEHIGLEMNLPVIMMSADDSKAVMMKGIRHGACDYLIKPVRIETLRNIWQHVVRNKKDEWKDFETLGSVEDEDRQQKMTEDIEHSSSANEGNWRSNSKRRKDEEDEVKAKGEERGGSSSLKKPRVVWSPELHQLFIAAVKQLGLDKAVPKKILELMNAPGLTRENVASHLQKYRIYLRKHQESEVNRQRANLQILDRPRANLQILDRPRAKSPMTMPLDNDSSQVNLLHGIPTNIEQKNLANLNQFGALSDQVTWQRTQNDPLLLQMDQPKSRPQLLSRHSNVHVSRDDILYNGIGSGILAGDGLSDNMRGQSSSIVDFSRNQNQELPMNVFPEGGHYESFDLEFEVKLTQGTIPSYDICKELNQQKFENWDAQNVGPIIDISSSSVILQQNFFRETSSSFGQPVLSTHAYNGVRIGPNLGQHINKFVGDIGEGIPELSRQNAQFTEHFDRSGGLHDRSSQAARRHWID